MQHIGDLLAGLPLPADVPGDPGIALEASDLLHDLGGDLPAGHLHLWGGPTGAGKTGFLLSLLLGACLRGRRGVYVTYHLPATSLAVRLLGMAAALDTAALVSGHLDETQTKRAVAALRCLRSLPLFVLEARGLTVSSIEDRLVRMPFRVEVVGVDYLQAVVREPDAEVGSTVRALSALASRLHLALVAALQAADDGLPEASRLADRAGWIAPAGGSGVRRAEVICNRYGQRHAVPLRVDASTGALRRVTGLEQD